MTIETIILGILVIWYMFYGKLYDRFNLFSFLGVFCVFVGFFITNCELGSFSINVLICAGEIMFLVAVLLAKKINIKYILKNVLLSLIIYGVLNTISIELNLYFNVLPLMFVIVLIHVSNLNAENVLPSVNGCLFVCELFNGVIMFSKMNFATIFSSEFVKCFVGINLISILIKFLINVATRRKYEKSC